MNVTINGYLAFRCNSCSKAHTLESQAFQFEEDASAEAEDDEYIRYQSKIDILCPTCSNRILVHVDVWEHPEAVVNYCYYGEEGASDIQCEFNIEHYFDDQAMKEEDQRYEQIEENEADHEDDVDDEETHHEASPIEVYMDRYDDED